MARKVAIVTLALICGAVVIACSGGSAAVAKTPSSATTAGDNVISPNTKVANGPLDSAPSGGYRIVPSDPSKYPSNAAGGNG
jgi:hypothetical protein